MGFLDNVSGAAGQNAASAAKRTTRRQGDLASKIAAEQEAALAPNARWTAEEKDAFYYESIQSLTAKFHAIWDSCATLVTDHEALIVSHDTLAELVDEIVASQNALAVDVEGLETAATPLRGRTPKAEESTE